MSNNQPTQQTNQTTGQPSKLEPVNEEPAAFPLSIDGIVEKYQQDPSAAIDVVAYTLTHFFKEAGIKNYMKVDFIYDPPMTPYSIEVSFPGMEDDTDIVKWSYDASKEIEKLMLEYIAGNQPPPLIGLDGHIANAAYEAIMKYAKIHGYKAVLFIGHAIKPKKTSDYDFTAILLKFD